MEVEITKLSSKGQIVIPLAIRTRLKLQEGTPIAVISQDESISLKKIEIPKIKSWKEVAKPFREAARKSGFTKEDLDLLIAESRKKK